MNNEFSSGKTTFKNDNHNTYIKSKIIEFGDIMKTHFHDNKVLKVNIPCKFSH